MILKKKMDPTMCLFIAFNVSIIHFEDSGTFLD